MPRRLLLISFRGGELRACVNVGEEKGWYICPFPNPFKLRNRTENMINFFLTTPQWKLGIYPPVYTC